MSNTDLTTINTYDIDAVSPMKVSTLNPQVAALGEWAEAASATQQVASALVQSSFVPAAFKNKPIEATAAILAGAEIGLQPMTALKAFDVIQGAAAPRAITLRAVVQAAGHEIVMVESTTTRCRMKGRRRGSDTWQMVDWTIDRAKQLGVTGKDNWKKQPQAMLTARATSELARLIAADAILGIGYSAEEIADGAAEALEVTASPQATPAKRTIRRHKPRTAPPKPLPEPEPEAETETETETVPASATVEGEAPSRELLDEIKARQAELGLSDEMLAKGLAYATGNEQNDLAIMDAKGAGALADYLAQAVEKRRAEAKSAATVVEATLIPEASEA